MDNSTKNEFNLDTAEILFNRQSRKTEELFLQMRAVIEQQAAQLAQYQKADSAKVPKKG